MDTRGGDTTAVEEVIGEALSAAAARLIGVASLPKWEWLEIWVVLDNDTLYKLQPDNPLQHQEGGGSSAKPKLATHCAVQTVIKCSKGFQRA